MLPAFPAHASGRFVGTLWAGRSRCRRCRSRSGKGRIPDLQIVDDLPHAGHRRRLTARRLPLRIIVDRAPKRYHAVIGLHRELLGRETGILAELALNLAGNLSIVGLLAAPDA